MHWVFSTLHTTSEHGVSSITTAGAHNSAARSRLNWRMQWVASTLHTTSEHGVSSINTADAHTSAASSRLNRRPPADLNGLVYFDRKRNLFLFVYHHISTGLYRHKNTQIYVGWLGKGGYVTRPLLQNHFIGNISIPKIQAVVKPGNLLLDRKTTH